MKRFILSVLLAAAIAGLTVQCATSNASETSYGMEAPTRDMTERNLVIKKPFTSINVRTGIKLIYTVGNSYKVRVVGPDDQVEHTVVTVEDGTLKVYLQRDQLSRYKNIDNLSVYVTAPAFRSVSMNSGACFTLTTAMSVPDDFTLKGSSGIIFKADKGLNCATLNVETSSGVIVDINGLKANTAHLSASSGAIVTLSGTVNTLNARLSSGAIAQLSDLQAKEGSVHASSGSTASVRKGNLSIKSSSGAIVHQK